MITATLFAVTSLNGCARLAPGSIQSANERSDASPIYLVRGFSDWYSAGIDILADDLRKHGLPAKVYRDEQWRDLAAALVQNRSRHSTPPVLVGYSYGADDVISIAEELGKNHTTVKLLVTIDPVTPDPVPENVSSCVNFYQPNGMWDVFPWLRGIPLEAQSSTSTLLQNVNVRDRQDLVEPNTSHSTIAGNAKIRQAIVDLILKGTK